MAAGGDCLERMNCCQGLSEMRKASDAACAAMATIAPLPGSAHSVAAECAVAGIGAFVTTSARSTSLVLCSIWVDPLHRRQGLWQPLLLDLMRHAEGLGVGKAHLELGAGLVTAFGRNSDSRRCLASIGWKPDTVGHYLKFADARHALLNSSPRPVAPPLQPGELPPTLSLSLSLSLTP